MLITVIGYAAIVTARINTRMVTGTNDWAKAGALAIAAAELAPLVLAETSDWRSTIISGQPIAFALGDGEVSIIFVDEDDGDFATGLYDPIKVYGMALVGDAVRVRSVLLTANTQVPMSCLEVAAHSVSDISGLLATITSNQTLSTSASVTGLLATINADVEYMGSVTGVTVNGTKIKVPDARTMPDPVTLFEYYVNNGTEIPLGDLPLVSGDPTIDATVLTPTYNPYSGGLNAKGIYVIDCAGGVVDIRNARIEGTIVLLNAEEDYFSKHCQITGKVSWKPAVPNYPALMVQGALDVGFDGGVQMSEADLGVNLNPTGAPYVGEEDSQLDDSYASRIQGLVYATRSLGFPGNTPTIKGVVLSGNVIGISGSTKATLNYDSRCYLDPPPGFGTGPYEPVVGTWQWDVAPCASGNTPCTNDSDCCSGTCGKITEKCMPGVTAEIALPL
jgi:hypothetical protein